ncbi:sensor histidine kinase [Mucilaginibacter auburnensis]|uniref:Histidine kinase n=1 Tax=Mucilaginibacter auburnensis TaxID=1457233 RepID=A0A2H9VQ50_9SPHI|nr:histidine kinase [Mucilaginibacter auburnensis]PJJ80468.1 histidine kinase [Mucilaginibacter auburnensis]
MKRSALILVLITFACTVFAQSTTTVVYKTAEKESQVVTFDGYHKLPLEGLSSVWVSVAASRIDDIRLSMREPVYAHGYKPDPKYPTRKWLPKTPIILGVVYTKKKDNYPPRYTILSLSKSYTGYMMSSENGGVEVVAMGVNESNLSDYRFRAIENDSTVIIPWTVPKLEQKHGAKDAYGYLGKFYFPNKEITVEIVNTKNYNVRDAVVLNWRNHLKPEITSIIGYIKGKGSNTINLGLRPPIHISADALEAVNISFKDHQTIPYDIYWVMNSSKYHSKTDTACIRIGLRENTFSLSNEYFAVPGSYKILVYPVGTKDENRKRSVTFKVDSVAVYNKYYSVIQIVPYVLLALLAFGIYYMFNKRRLRKLRRQKEVANLKLGSVRAQLNPHFMFNALTSIQNLMHQQDTSGANHYLSKFADLTRQVLNATTAELISLEDELKIIEDSLQIEQLRFGFAYNVNVDENINIANTEVPAMLMQPFIENAAKHGVSNKLHNGKIDINIARQQNDLLLVITDNGSGFNTQNNVATGFGLKISRERIALLNQLYKEQPITLQIGSDANGTKITILLSDWL